MDTKEHPTVVDREGKVQWSRSAVTLQLRWKSIGYRECLSVTHLGASFILEESQKCDFIEISLYFSIVLKFKTITVYMFEKEKEFILLKRTGLLIPTTKDKKALSNFRISKWNKILRTIEVTVCFSWKIKLTVN